MEHSLNTQTIVNLQIIGLLSILFIIPVLAVEDDIEEVVVKGKVLYADQVNALKTPIAVLNVPQSVSIITDEDMRKQGFRQIEDIIRYTPGVNASQGEGHRDSVVFRGIRSTADFFQDGIRDDVQYHRSLYNVEQIEILRGPNALLFGRGGAGGALNRVTKKAVFADSFGAIDFGFDDFGATDIALDYNIPSSSNSAIRLMIHGDVLKKCGALGNARGRRGITTRNNNDVPTLDLRLRRASDAPRRTRSSTCASVSARPTGSIPSSSPTAPRSET